MGWSRHVLRQGGGPWAEEEGTFASGLLTLWAVCSGRFLVLGIMGTEQHLLPPTHWTSPRY